MYMDRKLLSLLVEEELQNIYILQSYLKKLNIACVPVQRGEQALFLAATEQPDFILMDMMLSNFNTIQFINYLKQNPETATIPVIAATTSTREQYRNAILQTGVEDCISKPYDLGELELIISRLISRQKSSNSS
jgi:two-component system, cell cycle response regulator DivK